MIWKTSPKRARKRTPRIKLERLGLSPKGPAEVSMTEIRRQVQGIAQAGRTIDQGARSRLPSSPGTQIPLRSHCRGSKR